MDTDRNSPALRTWFRLLWWEGAFAMAYEAWIGPVYLSGMAGEVGVSVGMVSLLISVPFIGSVGQLVGVWAFERVPSLRRYTLGVAVLARALWLVPMLFAAWWGAQLYFNGSPFPTSWLMMLLALVACISALCATSSAAAWMAWMRELIPPRVLGRFFGTRQRFVMFALIAANLLASAWVGFKPGGYWLGYAALGLAALMAATLSTLLLWRVPEAPSFSGKRAVASDDALAVASARGLVSLAGPANRQTKAPRPMAEVFLEPLKDRKFRGFLLFSAAFAGAIQIAGPFFPYYFTKELGIPMSLVALWIVLNNLGCLVAAGFWGRWIDSGGSARRVLRISAYGLVLSPLPYVISSVGFIQGMAPVEYLLNGIMWSGYLLATVAMLFEAAPGGRNTVAYFSVYTAATGLSAAICNLLGGQLAVLLAPVGGFKALWVVAAALRLLVVLGLFDRLLNRTEEYSSAGMDGEKLAQPVTG